MSCSTARAVAIVGVGAIMPDAPHAAAFWDNITKARYSISDVDAERWDPALYWDADPKAPEKSYSKIGGWVRDWEWNPLGWKLPIPPKVGAAMDDAQKWAVACTRMVLADYGGELDRERTAVIIGNALAGEMHARTDLRLAYPELVRELEGAEAFAALPAEVRAAVAAGLHERFEADLPPTTEDSMPGELGNVIAGRIANLFDLRGPNFVTDAACASAVAAMQAAVEGLVAGQYDAVITGGVDRNMGASTFIKFCKIGALSATGTRPYADGADGFVMGEGAALFLLKRLADAERDGDRIYAVVRGIAGSSDGKGKGITAPNPIGQKLAIERAWRNAGMSPAECSLIEGHGTSTAVGDAVELASLAEAFSGSGLAPGAVALGSVKSNIGHLKGAAGAAGIFKAALALHHKVLPPSLNWDRPNPNVDWSQSPFAVNTELREWTLSNGHPRVAGVSAFGFGGTNFHAVLSEHVPGEGENGRAGIAVPAAVSGESPPPPATHEAEPAGTPQRGALLVGAPDEDALAARLRAVAETSESPPPAPPRPEDLAAPERVCIDYGDADELAAKAKQALRALELGNPAAWKALQGRGIFRGSGAPGKVAFLYTGQGSQYANMLRELRETEPVVAATFAEADEIMRPLLDGHTLSDLIFVEPERTAEAEAQLMRTEITQPAVITVDVAMTRLLAAHGIEPDFAMGHSVGEYGAMVAAGVLSFPDALEAVSARGREMAHLTVDDPGAMVAVSAPVEEVERILAGVDGYVVPANVNSTHQLVLGGATTAVEEAMAKIQAAGHDAIRLPVSHAFHTEIVAPASEPLRTMLRRLDLKPPRIPIVSNVSGEFYPAGDDAQEQFIDLLGRQIASRVEFVKGLRTLWDAGARVFVETGPKRALSGFASDVLPDAMSLFTNHPKVGEMPSFNQALCGLYAAGVGPREAAAPVAQRPAALDEPVVVTGAAVGTPGTAKVFDDTNLARLLSGEQFIGAIPADVRQAMADKHITRVVKAEDGSGSFHTIDDPAEVIKLAACVGELDLVEDFGVDKERVAALGRETQLALAAGIDALRDAGIPLVLHYKTTTRGTQLPEKWRLADSMQDETGVIFASAYPGYNDFAVELEAFWREQAVRGRLEELRPLRADLDAGAARDDVDRRISELEHELAEHPYRFDRRFLFRTLSMGHSQFAELIGARGPNTQINAACASTTQAVALAEDWIRAGRCARVVIVAADDVTSPALLPWVGSGFLASGAAATDERVEDAALPFDARRHGMILGTGAVGIVVESAGAARERGITPICEVLGSVTANSAFHGSRLDVEHIGGMMEDVVRQAEARGVSRSAIAPETVFVSHETYTPARGGSAAAEIFALRRVFGEDADKIVICNTKGLTGHAMGVGVEDVCAIKALETGLVPAVPNFREVDPELGRLNLSEGGEYPVRYALRLGAGFGSQISMTLMRWTPVADGRHRAPEELGFRYRIADEASWKTWLRGLSSQDDPQLEVVQHRLRLVDPGPASTNGKPALDTSNGHRPPAPPEPVAAAPAPPEAVAAAPAPPEAVAVTADRAMDAILEIVAEQTGYPADMLDPELDLEADLGIDTVKQAEMFAAIRERYGIERDDTLKLRDYPTLRHVAGFVEARTGTPAPAAAPDQAPAPPAATAAPAPAALTPGDALDAILEIVAEQTGYPADMLDPELDLEADLGIDTVKQAEMFAAIRERYGIERDDTLKLRDYPTLRHVAGFVEERAGKAPSPAAAPAPALSPAEPLPETPGFPRRVPVPVLRPALDRCVPTGVTLGAGSRVIVMADRGGVGAALTGRLRTLGAEVISPAQYKPGDKVQGVYWLPALDAEPPLRELDPQAWHDGLQLRVKRLAALMRELPEEAFLVAATRLGGRHGYDAAGATGVMGGAVTGFTKALARERPDTLIKAVDFEPARLSGEPAEILIKETLADPVAVEIGYADGLRWSVGLVEAELTGAAPTGLTPDTTFAITGAAGSIVSAITADLARAARGGTFHLLDIAPRPDASDPDLARIATDRAGLMRELADRMRAAGGKPTPKLVERELAQVERARAAADAIAAIESAGGTAHWHAVDLTDAAAVATALAGVTRVDVLIHAAGLDISHPLPDKPQPEYDLVFDVKADGWFNLLHALRDAQVGTAIGFSSIAGRFGNRGQTDYSAANDLLCKAVSSFRRTGGPKGIAIDWTAWAQIGMASRGSIPKVMAAAGIEMLPPDTGVTAVRRELAGPGGEVVVAGALGVLLGEGDPAGGLDPAKVPQSALGGRVTGVTLHDGLVVVTELDPSRQPFLDDHRIDGTPVLPGVMGMEAFAEAATMLAPGYTVTALEEVDLTAPFKFYRDEPRTLEVRALIRDAGDGTLIADCRLVGRRALPAGEQETVHFTGRVRLARAPLPAPRRELPAHPDTVSVGHDDVYRVYFHGPAYQVLAEAYRSDGEIVGRMAAALPTDHEPAATPLQTGPRLTELCFQTAGVWEIGTAGRMGLPTRVDRVTRFAGADDAGRLSALVRPRPDGGVDADVVDEHGSVRLRLEGYRTTTLPAPLAEAALAPLRAVAAGSAT